MNHSICHIFIFFSNSFLFLFSIDIMKTSSRWAWVNTLRWLKFWTSWLLSFKYFYDPIKHNLIILSYLKFGSGGAGSSAEASPDCWNWTQPAGCGALCVHYAARTKGPVKANKYLVRVPELNRRCMLLKCLIAPLLNCLSFLLVQLKRTLLGVVELVVLP